EIHLFTMDGKTVQAKFNNHCFKAKPGIYVSEIKLENGVLIKEKLVKN
ncbi:MAG: hypothetical protein ACI9YL_001980, partial [Luteibaculaceae bacterium]